MSVAALNWAFCVTGISHTQKVVLLALANRADLNHEPHCFPSQKLIAEECCLSKRSVVAALQGLEAAGLISKAHRQREDGSRTSDKYWLNTDIQSARASLRPDIQSEAPAPHSEAPASQSEAASHHEPSLEPSLEPKDNTSSLESDFDEWWQGYPRKVGKGGALRAYKAARKKTDAQSLLAGVAAYCRTKPDYADWCHPSTWLNGERWLDEPEEPPPRNGAFDWQAHHAETDRLLEQSRKKAGLTREPDRRPDAAEQL